MLKPKHPFLVHSKLSLGVILDLVLNMRNALICLLTFDDFTLERTTELYVT
jgi:hypothetical protein